MLSSDKRVKVQGMGVKKKKKVWYDVAMLKALRLEVERAQFFEPESSLSFLSQAQVEPKPDAIGHPAYFEPWPNDKLHQYSAN